MLTDWKKQEELNFLNEVSCVPLQQGLRHLQTAFTNFFAGRTKYPNFKKKHQGGSAELTKSALKFKDKNGTVQTVGLTMTEILTLVKIFWPQGLRCQSVERPDDQNRVNLLRQVRKILRERSRNLNREVWESPSVYGGEDVNWVLCS